MKIAQWALLFVLFGSGFMAGEIYGSLRLLVKDMSIRFYMFCGVSIITAAVVACAMFFGMIGMAYSLDSATMVKTPDGTPVRVTVGMGPFKMTRDIPTEIVTEPAE